MVCITLFKLLLFILIFSFFDIDIYQSDASEDSKVGILDGSTMQYTNLTSPNASDPKTPSGPKTWTAEDMESALDALRTHNMSLTKVSGHYMYIRFCLPE